MAAGEVGKVGVAIDSIDDMQTLFDEIPLDKVTTSMTINATASILLALYVAVGQGAGRRRRQARRHRPERHPQGIHRARDVHLPAAARACGSSPTSSRTARTTCRSGTRSRSPATTCARRAARRPRRSRSRSRTASRTWRPRSRPGLDIDDFAGRLSFFFACHNNFLEEVAKFRAARRLWAKIMKERFNAKSAALADAALPHADRRRDAHGAAAREQHRAHDGAGARRRARRHAVAAHELDGRGARACRREKAVQIALRTQQVLAYENGVGDVVDPLGGSYFVEDMTNRLEAEATGVHRRRSTRWAARSSRSSRASSRREIQEAAYRFQLQIEAKERVIVGVNDFVIRRRRPAGDPARRPDHRPAPGRKAARSCAPTRDNGSGRSAPGASWRPAARGTDNLHADHGRVRRGPGDARRDQPSPAGGLGRAARAGVHLVDDDDRSVAADERRELLGRARTRTQAAPAQHRYLPHPRHRRGRSSEPGR